MTRVRPAPDRPPLAPLPIDPEKAKMQADIRTRMRSMGRATDWITATVDHLSRQAEPWHKLTDVAAAIGCSDSHLRHKIREKGQNRVAMRVQGAQWLACADRAHEPMPARKPPKPRGPNLHERVKAAVSQRVRA